MASKAGKAATVGAVYTAAKRTQNGHSWAERFHAFPRMLRELLTGKRTVKPTGIILPLLGYLYVLSPVDFLPEILLGIFGLGDDLLIAVASTVLLIRTTDDWITAQRQPSPPSTRFPPATGETIQGEVIL